MELLISPSNTISKLLVILFVIVLYAESTYSNTYNLYRHSFKKSCEYYLLPPWKTDLTAIIVLKICNTSFIQIEFGFHISKSSGLLPVELIRPLIFSNSYLYFFNVSIFNNYSFFTIHFTLIRWYVFFF